ncbi:transketolase family protein [Clostridium bowmanii]|uniref:transketolase family protein n=1 Tax=Clostridium bowmanii TaxID=132925 RepID=UPI001C0B284E|nr:transketolase C-terminal domain-containing protein [Clostridium bowmanii]MBU3188365.1 transketolase family protein [Clostridium bowmanii]MCA1072751.1 transketolase family protein [Clostridium bowmanii]
MTNLISPRDAFGRTLAEIGEINEKVFVVSADLAAATKTDIFAKKFKNRYINVGICEQNMVGVAAGLARTGFIPVMSTFACFAPGRCYDQIRQSIAYSNLNVKVISTHPGLSVGPDGAIHQSLDDIALMRELPNFVVLTPSDEIETKKAIEKAIEHEGPVYVRVGRKECTAYFKEEWSYEIGKWVTIKEGVDITFIAHGCMVEVAYSAAAELQKQGTSARVIIATSIKPIDKEIIIKAAKETKKIITIEDHFINGGLYSTVCEVTASEFPCSVRGLAVMDHFGESGSPKELYEKYGLTVEDLVKEAKKIIN